MPPTDRDLSSPLVRHAGIIRDQIHVIAKAVEPYLIDREERPDIAEPLLRVLVSADALLEQVSPAAHPQQGFGEAVGMTSEEFDAVTDGPATAPRFRSAHGLDFYPWMHEKVTYIKQAAVRLSESWMQDPRTIRLWPEAPMSPRQFLRDEILRQIGQIQHNAAKVFDALFDGAVTVASTEAASTEHDPARPGDREASGLPAIPSLRPLSDESIALIKIGLAPSAWTEEERAWRAGAFPETRARMAAALDGSDAPVRILNVQHHHGADVSFREGRVNALLWKTWNPVFYDLLNHGIRGPASEDIERRVAAWAATRPEFILLDHHDRLALAVARRAAIEASTLHDAMRQLVVLDEEVRRAADATRALYDAELTELCRGIGPTESSADWFDGEDE